MRESCANLERVAFKTHKGVLKPDHSPPPSPRSENVRTGFLDYKYYRTSFQEDGQRNQDQGRPRLDVKQNIRQIGPDVITQT